MTADSVPERSKSPYCNAWLVTLVTGIALVAVLACLYRERPFEAGTWHKARASKNYRILFAMADDAAAKISAARPSRAEVIQMLGQPDGGNTRRSMYHLGAHFWGSIIADGCDLAVVFDERTNQVEEAYTFSH